MNQVWVETSQVQPWILRQRRWEGEDSLPGKERLPAKEERLPAKEERLPAKRKDYLPRRRGCLPGGETA